MAKQQSSLYYVYMVGMLLVLISCFLPLGSFLVLKGTLISTVKNGSGILQAGALITLIGTIAGIIVFFVYNKFIAKLICYIVTLSGFLYIYLNMGKFAKSVSKMFIRSSNIEFGAVLLILGLVIALAGLILNRKQA